MRSWIKCSLIYLVSFSSVLFANNLKVQNASLVNQQAGSDYTYVQFDVSWDNSWRDVVNWDAAWVFVKYRGSDGLWKHATLSATGGDHTAPGGSTISAASDGKGIFIYRNTDGSGSNSWMTVQLRWNYGIDGLADNAFVTVKVFAVEMVYVPQGQFSAGDGSNTSSSFYDAGLGNLLPFTVASQSALTISSSGTGNLWAGGVITAGTSNTNYPTGYNAFYCMKYETTQEQYLDFLNSLTRTQQTNRVGADVSPGTTSVSNRYVMSNTSSLSTRNGIRCDATISGSAPVNFYDDYDGDGIGGETNDGQNIPSNWMYWPDAAAYLDWAALRPITELEYEKACRGDLPPIPGEFAWGNTSIYAGSYTSPSAILNPGAFNESISGQATGTGNAAYTITVGGFLLRAGIFALSTTTRQESGASYYGVLDLTGNAFELSVTIGNASGFAYDGSHGNGILSSNGYANQSWPGLVSGEVTGSTGIGMRGGSAGSAVSGCTVSSRAAAALTFSTRDNGVGCRGARTAP